MALEALKILTDFFSNNSITIVVIVLLVICKDAISNFISRLTSLKYQTKEANIGIEASIPKEEIEKNIELRNTDEKPSLENGNSKIENKEEQWAHSMHKAFEEENFEEADAIFRKYASSEKDDVELERNKAFYFYLKFKHGRDNSAIHELQKLSETALTEESKFNTLSWLSFCFSNAMQYEKESKMWKSAIDDISSETLKKKMIVNLAYSLNKENLPNEAKKILIDNLPTSDSDTQKASIYKALSKVESSIGNESISIYCHDKSLEFDANNRDELFDSAYTASNIGINEISISNYVKLIRIDEKNSNALNNLGVHAQNAGFNINAVRQYKESSQQNNTLSMANQGYLLLEAGFTDEAEKIAKEALEHEIPHQNIHSLLAEINNRRTKQNDDWEELSQKSLDRQKQIREYTEQYYLGNKKTLEGDWVVNNSHIVNFKIEDNSIEITWDENSGLLGDVNYKVEIRGQVSGSTINGVYKRIKNEVSTNTLLGVNTHTHYDCIGYISKNNNEFKLFSKKLQDDFNLTFQR